MSGTHIPARNGGQDVFPESFGDIDGQVPCWLLREMLKPLLHE